MPLISPLMPEVLLCVCVHILCGSFYHYLDDNDKNFLRSVMLVMASDPNAKEVPPCMW